MGDWTREAQRAIDLCTNWAVDVQSTLTLDIYLFGSAIYKGGEQFDGQTSDLDMAVVFPASTTAFDRVDCLRSLQEFKARLELEIIPALGRGSCVEPGVSLVPVTPFEVVANIHKSGARQFFDKNFYLDLRTGIEQLGLPDAGTVSVPDEHRYALEYVQKVRNRYLAKSADLQGGMPDYSGIDPMPKELLRIAAQLNVDAGEGEWYDTREGLELLFSKLRERRLEHPSARDLFDLVSVRRGGRGLHQPLTDLNQLLLAEILHDIASDVAFEDVVIWEIRFSGGAFTEPETRRLLRAITRLVPGARIIDIRSGSVIFRMRGSYGGFEILQRLYDLDVLHRYFEVDEVELRQIDGDRITSDDLPQNDRETQIIKRLQAWVPDRAETERDLHKSLQEWLEGEPRESWLDNATLVHEPNVTHYGKTMRPDFGIFWPIEDGRTDFIAIEVTWLRGTSQFFHQLERYLEAPYRVLVVVVGSAERLARIEGDVERLRRLSGRVRIFPVPISD